jgi:hypothetical protein
MLGEIESRRGKLDEATAHFRRALDLDAANIKALYALAEQTERQGTPGSGKEALQFLLKILAREPHNTAVLLDATRLAARTGDVETTKRTLAGLSLQARLWPQAAKARMQSLELAANQENASDVVLELAFLRNVLVRVPNYRQSADEVKTPASSVGEPFRKFVRLPSPSPDPAEPDMQTRFLAATLDGTPKSGMTWVRAVDLDGSGKPSLLWSTGGGVHLPGGAILNAPVNPTALAAVDLNYDFRTDLVLAGPRGLAIYRQEAAGQFTDVTSRTGLPAAVIHGSYTGAWPCDVDLDGDADIVLGVADRPPLVLRNNGDGTFATLQPFAASRGVVAMAFADLDGDGDPDIAMVGQGGSMTIYINQRMGDYETRAVPANVGAGVVAIAAADIDGDGTPDFVVLKADGEVVRLSLQNGSAWDTAVLLQTKLGSKPGEGVGTLAVADFDNNGSLDLLVDGQLFLGSARGFAPAGPRIDVVRPEIADVDGDGRLDLIGVSSAGPPVRWMNHGSRNYHWQDIRLRAAQAYGDQRIPSFGLGAEVEIRAGLLTEKQIATAPSLHFGLGEQAETDLARIVWPTGVVQVEFELKGNQSVAAQQRLKGSCPSLFAWDGSRMTFVKDSAPWSTVLGVHTSKTEVATVARTTEWFNIPGKRLAPHDGYYDLRVTDELWEVYYIDFYGLLVIDHPLGTEVHADERYADPPPPLKIYVSGDSRPFQRAITDSGEDVTAIVRDLDEDYLDTFGRGKYQNLTRDHWVELELPQDASSAGPLYLIADGWADPADETTLMAMTHSREAQPQDLRIEVPDARGEWSVAKRNLGMPAGKFKTCVLDLTGIFRPGAPRKLRLRTNMRIYWDRLAWAKGLPASRIQTHELKVASAELRSRGYSFTSAANAAAPETLDYNRLESTSQKWRDLEGYYTRPGEVGELLSQVDDRYVIMASGDELRLRFREQPPPPSGWLRDYVLIGDGWIKDGDLNTAFSTTILPLPYHRMKGYGPRPRELEDDPVYRKNASDWQRFHTRYIAPEWFRSALWK